MSSVFNWRDQPSTVGEKRKPDSKQYIPIPLTFSKRVHSSSIASTEKSMQKPGTGRSATAWLRFFLASLSAKFANSRQICLILVSAYDS